MKFFGTKKSFVALLVISLVALGYCSIKISSLQEELRSIEAVPDVTLSNTLRFDNSGFGIGIGSVTGFVAFDDITQQPKNMRQYYRIAATENFEDGKQVYELTEIIKMAALAPHYYDPTTLTVSNIEGGMITLSDGENNLYLINQSTQEVTLFDAGKDVATLITDQSKFWDFIRGR